jgi:hypothetical protein
VLTGKGAGFSLSNNVTVERTYPVRDPSTVSHNLLLVFTPAAGGSPTPRPAAARRQLHQQRDLHLEPERAHPDLGVTTIVPLEWDASCPTDRKIVAGEIHATLGDGSYVRTTWTGWGEDPARVFVPAI